MSSNMEIGGCSPTQLKEVRSSCKTSSSSPLKRTGPLGSITNRAAPAYGGGGGGGGGRLGTISSGDSDAASSRHSGVLTQDAAAAKIQAIARGKQARRDFLRSALRCKVEMDQLGRDDPSEHRLAEAAEAAAARAGLEKSSRLRRAWAPR